MKRDSAIQTVAAIGLVVSLTGASWLMPRMTASSSEHQLRYTDESTEGAPLAVTVAQSVGVLRGIVVNYLWIRAEKLKEEGKFFESYSLANWITQLQPRFAKVWAFQGWNMAYNISVATHTKEERWKWVNDGVRLVRDKGLRYNPNDMMLYKELAWYFLHKIGGFTDDAHLYYKQQMAHEWQALIGDPPHDIEARKDLLREIVEAPEYLDRLYENNPACRDLVQALEEADLVLNQRLLEDVEWINATGTSYVGERAKIQDRIAEFTNAQDLDEESERIIGPIVRLLPIYQDPAFAEAWPNLLGYLRKQILRNDYNMEPAYMLRCMDEYGPLDWRAPAAHVVYWSSLGVERGMTRASQIDFDRINTDRLLFHAQQQLKFNGSVYYDYLTREISWGPDLRFIPYYERTFLIVLEREVSDPDRVGPGAAMTYVGGYRNFMIDCVREYYTWGYMEEAQEYYRRLRTTPMFQEPGKEGRFLKPIEIFIRDESVDRFTSPQVARNDIFGRLVTALRIGLVRGDGDQFSRQVNEARWYYDYFMEEVGNVKTLITERNRLGFPTFEEMFRQAFVYVMTTDSVATLGERMIIWESSNAFVQQFKLETYDEIVDSMRVSFQRAGYGLTFDDAFPPPPGLGAYRQARGIEPEESEKGDIEMERK